MRDFTLECIDWHNRLAHKAVNLGQAFCLAYLACTHTSRTIVGQVAKWRKIAAVFCIILLAFHPPHVGQRRSRQVEQYSNASKSTSSVSSLTLAVPPPEIQRHQTKRGDGRSTLALHVARLGFFIGWC